MDERSVVPPPGAAALAVEVAIYDVVCSPGTASMSLAAAPSQIAVTDKICPAGGEPCHAESVSSQVVLHVQHDHVHTYNQVHQVSLHSYSLNASVGPRPLSAGGAAGGGAREGLRGAGLRPRPASAAATCCPAAPRVCAPPSQRTFHQWDAIISATGMAV